jgi:hypothetical protein
MNRTLFRVFARIYIKNEARRSGNSLKQSIEKRLERYALQIESFTNRELAQRISTEKWNSSEVMFHVLHAAGSMFRMAQQLRDGLEPPDLQPDRIGKTRSVTREDLIALCKEVQETAANFDYSDLESKTARHPLVGQMNWKQWIALNLIHLERHQRQIQRTVLRH